MIFRFSVLVTILLFSSSVFAQHQPFGHLTIFSEDGDKFFLILNGEKINDVAQANLRVEELTQPHYTAKIIFEDNTKAEITKNFLQIADVDGLFMDVTYKVKRDKNNSSKMKLNFFSMVPVVQGFVAPANVFVTRIGAPASGHVVHQPAGTVTQTTTTTTNGVGINAGVHVGGVGVNVSVNAPTIGMSVTETTTVSSTHSGTTNSYDGCFNGRPMNNTNFTSALQTVKSQNFDDTKLNTAKQIASSNCLRADQIAQLCQSFGFEESKLEFAKFAYNACVEPNNYFKVNNVFTFSSSADELTKYVQQQ